MNYFQLFDCEENLFIDRPILENKFYALCRIHHPDSNQSSEDIVVPITAINIAYETLKHPQKRLAYLLDLRGVKINEEDKVTFDNVFLMNMLELHEEIEYARLHAHQDSKDNIDATLKSAFIDIEKPIKFILDNSDSQFIITDKDIALLKTYYFKKKYLDRLLNQFQFIKTNS